MRYIVNKGFTPLEKVIFDYFNRHSGGFVSTFSNLQEDLRLLGHDLTSAELRDILNPLLNRGILDYEMTCLWLR